jgi:3-hydroxyacyl-CoA dehydrogenase
MVESGRLGQKTGAGFYLYDDKKRRITDEHVLKIFKTAAQGLKIKQRTYTDQQISERLILAIINEGVTILSEGIVDSVETIDTIWLNGYGFPRYKGGPMFYAKKLGWEQVKERLIALHKETKKDWWIPPYYIDSFGV